MTQTNAANDTIPNTSSIVPIINILIYGDEKREVFIPFPLENQFNITIYIRIWEKVRVLNSYGKFKVQKFPSPQTLSK